MQIHPRPKSAKPWTPINKDNQPHDNNKKTSICRHSEREWERHMLVCMSPFRFQGSIPCEHIVRWSKTQLGLSAIQYRLTYVTTLVCAYKCTYRLSSKQSKNQSNYMTYVTRRVFSLTPENALKSRTIQIHRKSSEITEHRRKKNHALNQIGKQG